MRRCSKLSLGTGGSSQVWINKNKCRQTGTPKICGKVHNIHHINWYLVQRFYTSTVTVDFKFRFRKTCATIKLIYEMLKFTPGASYLIYIYIWQWTLLCRKHIFKWSKFPCLCYGSVIWLDRLGEVTLPSWDSEKYFLIFLEPLEFQVGHEIKTVDFGSSTSLFYQGFIEEKQF